MIRYRRSCRLLRAVLGLYMLMCMISTTAFSADTAATAPQPPPGGFGGAGTQPGREGGATPPGPPPDGEGDWTPPGPPPGGFQGGGAVDHGTYAALVDKDAAGADYSSAGDKENAVRVAGSTVVLSDITIDKASGAAGTGDASNFYGCNAGLLAMGKADVTINGANVSTSAPGADGIFSYGAGTKVTLNNVTIRTTNNSSGGIMVAGGGTMYVSDCDIETQGGSSAALRSDRGGGTLAVTGGTHISHGPGSPAVYCTARVSANNATLTATSSEAIVIEGKNGGQCVFTADRQEIVGNTIVDKISTLDFTLTSGSTLRGTINNANSGGSVTVHIDETSRWILAADAYVTNLTGTTESIIPNGFTVYVNGIAAIK